jgi:putative hydrolases of HD superfamily
MKTKAPLPLEQLHGKQVLPLIEAYFEFNHLKQLYRQGWLLRGVLPERCESVADHIFGVAILAMLLAETHFPELDAGKVIRLALLHDFGEIYAGDITPFDGIDRAEKIRREQAGVAQVLAKLPQGERYLALWKEYEGQHSPEARFVRQIDRLEMALQASVYEGQGLGDLSEFFDYVRSFLSEPELQRILRELEGLR